MKLHSIIKSSACVVAFAASSHAATLIGGVTLDAISGLGEDSTYAVWDNLRIYREATGGITGTGTFPGTTMWAPIAPQGGNDANALLSKVSNGAGGGPYAASASFYYGGFSGDPNVDGGTLAVGSTVPLDNLSSIIFQIQLGEAFTYDFFNHTLPTLTYTTASGSIAGVTATYSSLYDQYFNGTIPMPTGPNGEMVDEPLYINTYALQWDLSGVDEEITGFQVSFTAVQHAQLYGVSLQQGNEAVTANLLPIPEPSTTLLGALGFLAILRRKR